MMMKLKLKFGNVTEYTVLVVLTIAVIAAAANTSIVSAQVCNAQLDSPIMSTAQYYNSNIGITVPVSTTCSFFGNSLYAVGTAYDETYNANVGTSNAVLSPANGGSVFNGQLQFNLPASVEGHTVQISATVYNGQYGYYSQPYSGQYYNNGSPLATASESFQVNAGYYQTYPYATYPSYSNYPSYSSYPSYYRYPNYNTNSPYNNYYQSRNYNYYGSSYYGTCRLHFHMSNRYYCVYR